MKAIFYVSQSALPPAAADEEVETLVAAARAHNGERGVTGCLLFSGARFAQWLEGPAEFVDPILTSIVRDPRHEKVTILFEGPVDDRLFAGWSLAHGQSSHYVDRLIKPLTGDNPPLERESQVAALLDFMKDSVAQQREAPPQPAIAARGGPAIPSQTG